MATNKRASMREGPLAALFRKTAEEGSEPDTPAPAEEGGETQSSPAAPQTPAARAEAAARSQAPQRRYHRRPCPLHLSRW